MSSKFKFILFLLIFPFSQQSNARRNLSDVDIPRADNTQISPLISPVSSVDHSPAGAPAPNFSGGGSQSVPGFGDSPKAEPIGTVTEERCGFLSSSCKDGKDMTACFTYAGTGPKVPFLIVQNDGDNSLKVNLMFLPANETLGELELSKRQAKKLNISEKLGGIQSIVLKAGDGYCTIHMVSSAPQENNFYKHFHSYATYLTPIHGVYVLFLTAIVIGGIWACCKLGKEERHLEGVPYQELEMEQTISLSATNVETGEGWDQGWDDDWDEEKAVKSPDGNHVGNGRANGNGRASKSSDNDGWGNDWDD